jgi:hypothetical protein
MVVRAEFCTIGPVEAMLDALRAPADNRIGRRAAPFGATNRSGSDAC